MLNPTKTPFFYTLLLLLLGLSACSGKLPEATPLSLATNTPNATVTPTLQPIPSTHTPVTTATLSVESPITVVNALRMDELFRFGRGTISEIAIRPDGAVLAVASTLGVWLYDMDSLALLHSLEGQGRGSVSVAWSPDGNLLASSDKDGTIQVWNGEGKIVQTLEGQLIPGAESFWYWDGNQPNLAWSPDGNRLAAGKQDGRVLIWNVTSGEMIETLDGYLKFVSGMAWSPDGNRLSFGGANDDVGIVWLWSPGSGEVVSVLESIGEAGRVGWSPDGSRLAAEWGEWCIGQRCRSVRVWEAATGQEMYLDGKQNFAWSPDDGKIALGNRDNRLELWDIAEGELVQILDGQGLSSYIEDITWSPDGSQLITSSENGEIWFWDIAKGEVSGVIEEHSPVSDPIWSPDGQHLVFEQRNVVYIWNAVKEETVLSLEGQGGNVLSLAWSPDGSRLVLESRQVPKIFEIFDATSGEVVVSWEENVYWWVNNVAWSPDGKLIAGGGSTGGGENGLLSGHTIVWDSANGEYADFMEIDAFSIRIAWIPSGNLLAVVGDSLVSIWDISNGELKHSLEGPPDYRVTSFSWSPEGTLFITSGHDGKMVIWDVERGETIQVLEGHESSVESVSWAPDGGLFASGSSDGSIRLWNTTNWELVNTLTASMGSIESVIWSPDGALIAAGGSDGNIYIWEAASGSLLNTLTGHSSSIANVTFSHDGTLLVSESPDGTLKLWGIDISITP